MMIVGSEEYLVGDHFGVAIMYGDVTGLEDADEVLLDQWLAEVHNNPLYADCGVVIDFGVSTCEFAKCSVTGLMSLCSTVRIEYLKGGQ